MATLAELQKEMEPFQGTLVIGDWDNVVLLKDVIDGGDDYYWVYFGRIHNTKCEYHSTCVGGWIPLKGLIPDKDYNELVRVWNLNNNQSNQAK